MSDEQDFDLEVSKDYKLGFNQSYRMAKDFPDLYQQMQIPTKNEPSDYTRGWEDGRIQFEKDMRLDQLREHQKSKQRDRSKGPER